MSDSLYVNDNGTPVPLNLGTGIEFVERIEALEQQNAAQSTRDAEQDAAISSAEESVTTLDATLRALIAEEVAKLLPLDGSKQMSGPLLTTANSNDVSPIQLFYNDFIAGQKLTSNQYSAVSWFDKLGQEVGRILGYVNTTGGAGIGIRQANAEGKYGGALAVGTKADGTGFCTFGGKDMLIIDSSSFAEEKGYIKFTNGLLIHWVHARVSNSPQINVNFSPAFSSVTSYVLVATGRYVGNTANYNPAAIRISASSARFESMITNYTNNAAGFIAIGY